MIPRPALPKFQGFLLPGVIALLATAGHTPVRGSDQPESLWGVTIGPLAPGIYEYFFVHDGAMLPDPRNPKWEKGPVRWPRKYSVLSGPRKPKPDPGTNPHFSVDGSLTFTFHGSVRQGLYLVHNFDRSTRTAVAFQPLNDSARFDRRTIEADHRLGRLSGVVVDEAQNPLPKARVRVTYEKAVRTAVSDREGRFSFSHLPAGNVSLQAQAQGGFLEQPLRARIHPELGETVITIPLSPGIRAHGTVRGMLRGPAGEIVRGAGVRVQYSQGHSQSADTDERGEFEIRRLHPGPAKVGASVWNTNGSNPWIEGQKVINLKEHSFHILEGTPTRLELFFPESFV